MHEKMGSRKAHKSWRNPLRTGNKLVYWDVLPKAAGIGFLVSGAGIWRLARHHRVDAPLVSPAPIRKHRSRRV